MANDWCNCATRYAYVSNLTSLVDAALNTTMFEYDRLDRQTANTNQLGGRRTFAYGPGEATCRTETREARFAARADGGPLGAGAGRRPHCATLAINLQLADRSPVRWCGRRGRERRVA